LDRTVRYTTSFQCQWELELRGLVLIDIVSYVPETTIVTCGKHFTYHKLLCRQLGLRYQNVPVRSRAIRGNKGELESRSAIISGYYMSQLYNKQRRSNHWQGPDPSHLEIVLSKTEPAHIEAWWGRSGPGHINGEKMVENNKFDQFTTDKSSGEQEKKWVGRWRMMA